MSRSFIEDERRYRGAYQRGVFETIAICYRPFFWSILLVLVLGFLGRMALLANANVIGIWVDSICRGAQCRPVPTIFHGWQSSHFVLFLATVTALGFVLTVSFRVLFSRLSAQAVSQLYDEVTYRTSRYEMSFFDRTPVGRVVTRFSSDYGSVFRIFGGPLAEFIGIIFDLVAVIVLMALAGPAFLWVFAIMAALNLAIYSWRRESLRAARREVARSRSPAVAHYAETVQGALAIRVFGRQREFTTRFLSWNSSFVMQRLSTASEVNRFSALLALVTAFGLASSSTLGLWLVSQGLASVGSLGVAFAFVTVSAFSIQIFFEWMAQFEEALAGVERLDEYLRRPLEPGASLPAAARFQIGTDPTPEMVTSAFGPHENTPRSVSRNESIRGCHLSVQGLSLRYSADGPLVLDDVSFDLKPGQVLGVVGRTGSGKSSLIQALFHLYPLSAGKILINGQTARLARLGRLRADEQEQADTVSLDAFREQIALVTQDPVLLSGTVRDNLDLASEHSDQELFRALRLVGLGDWANEQGLARVIEERGRNISTGERQLVALARALLRSAPLVVLDEATASVDPLAEQTMMAATREFFKGRTQIVVAHRLSTLEHCDLVIWLDQGKVRAFGERGQVLKDFTAADLSTAQAT